MFSIGMRVTIMVGAYAGATGTITEIVYQFYKVRLSNGAAPWYHATDFVVVPAR